MVPAYACLFFQLLRRGNYRFYGGLMSAINFQNPAPSRFLRLRDVINRVGMKKSSIYALMKKGEFPKQIKLSARSSAWVESEIDEWVDSRVAARDMEMGG